MIEDPPTLPAHVPSTVAASCALPFQPSPGAGCAPSATSNARSETPAKFAALFDARTSGINYEVTTERIVQVFGVWDERFGVEISDVSHDRVVVSFTRLPDDVSALAREIYELCPDVIEQGYGCMDEMVEMTEETGRELSPDLAALVEGIDFSDENFGLLILQRDLKAKRQVGLWWD